MHRIQRDGELLALDPALALRSGDQLVVSARRGALLRADRDIGPELDDPALLAVPMHTAAVVVTSAEVNGMTLGALADEPRGRGVYLDSIQRGSELIPREPWTVVQRGDILRIIGAPDAVERAGTYIGFIERDLAKTDLMFLAGGICAGMLLGLLKLQAGGVVLGLGTAGSILVVGLVAGWARAPLSGLWRDSRTGAAAADGHRPDRLHRHRRHARRAARRRGVSHRAAARSSLNILLAGMIVTIVPLAAGAIVARYWLKMSPLMTLGGVAGAQTCTPGLNALREASGSNIGSLAYTVPYAIGNILLTVWGPVVVAIVHAMRTP